jgi:hypothetical protein
MLTELQFDSESSTGRGRGRGGAGGRAGGPQPAPAAARQAGPGPVTLAPPSSPQSGGLSLTGAHPRGYQVQVSMDGTTWSAPVAEGQGGGRSTTISFPPVRAKFVRITQTASSEDAPPWAVMLLRLYESTPR